MMRPKTAQILLDRCLMLAKLSPCLKRQFGAVIVETTVLDTDWRNPCELLNEIQAYGVNHEPSWQDCPVCLRDAVDSGTRLELCRALHAEQAAILDFLANGSLSDDLHGFSMIVKGRSGSEPLIKKNPVFYCTICARMMSAVNLDGVVIDTEAGPCFMTITEAWNSAYATASGEHGNGYGN